MQHLLQDFFEYNQFQNRQLIGILEVQVVPEKVLLLFSHILNAHQIWLNRIRPDDPAFGVWQIHPTEQLASLNARLHERSFELLREENLELQKNISYQTTSGKAFSNSLQEILIHIANHGTHHRAQIATLLRTGGIAPPAMDYIFYKR